MAKVHIHWLVLLVISAWVSCQIPLPESLHTKLHTWLSNVGDGPGIRMLLPTLHHCQIADGRLYTHVCGQVAGRWLPAIASTVVSVAGVWTRLQAVELPAGLLT